MGTWPLPANEIQKKVSGAVSQQNRARAGLWSALLPYVAVVATGTCPETVRPPSDWVTECLWWTEPSKSPTLHTQWEWEDFCCVKPMEISVLLLQHTVAHSAYCTQYLPPPYPIDGHIKRPLVPLNFCPKVDWCSSFLQGKKKFRCVRDEIAADFGKSELLPQYWIWCTGKKHLKVLPSRTGTLMAVSKEI